MIFRPELAAKVMAGEKTVTRRLASDNPRSPWWRERCIYVAGKRFAVQPGRGKTSIGFARVVSSSREPLGVLTNTEATREGGVEFGNVWKAINGRYDPDARVWRIEFEVCE